MKLICTAFLLLFVFGFCQHTQAQTDPRQKGLDVISDQGVKGQLDFLASDWMEGRNATTKGIALAADYITSMFQVYGLKPWRSMPTGSPRIGGGRAQMSVIGEQGFFQDFALLKIAPTTDHTLALVTKKEGGTVVQTFAYETDFLFGGYNISTGGISGDASLVFVGYGLSDEKNGYDDFKGLDVKGKILVRLSGFPGHKDTSSVAYKKFKPKGANPYFGWSFETLKNNAAFSKGAIAVVELNANAQLPNLGSPKNTFRFFSGDLEFDEYPAELYNNRLYLVNDSLDKVLPMFAVSKRLSYELTRKGGLDLAAFEQNAADKLKPASKDLPGMSVRFTLTASKPEVYRGRNVLGVIEGENNDEAIVVGAHYDHKGKYNGIVWNGADDNASGTVAVMTIARACQATGVKPKRTIIFAAWDAEEEGLLGSKYFTRYPIRNNIFANINFDMISRDSDRDTLGVQCGLTYTKAFNVLKSSTEKDLADFHIGLKMNYNGVEKPSGGSDFNYFAAQNIPIMAYMTAMHKDYHRPGDKPYKVNITKMTNVIRIGFLNTWKLANIDKL